MTWLMLYFFTGANYQNKQMPYTANKHGPFMVSLWSDHGTFDITKSYRNLELRSLESIVKFP